MTDPVVIDRQFRGPSDSANGGYACGMLAAHVDAPAVEVTLRLPPPLERELSVVVDDEGAKLMDGDDLVAEAKAAEIPELDFPAPVSVDDAAASVEAHDHSEHPFPMCFVCGPDRHSDGGLGMLCGPAVGRQNELVAGVLKTNAWMAGEDGKVRDEIVWSALDCPSGIGPIVLADPPDTSVLGRLTGHIARPLEIGRSYAGIGWPITRDGRKTSSATAILDQAGQPIAWSAATWIELKPA